jgi:hypothetical protein
MPLVYFDCEHAYRWDGLWSIRESDILGFGEHLERVQLCQAVILFVIGLVPNGGVGITCDQCLLECRWRRLRLKPFGRDVKGIFNDAFFSVFMPDD